MKITVWLSIHQVSALNTQVVQLLVVLVSPSITSVSSQEGLEVALEARQ